MAKKLKETDRHTDGRTYGLPLVVLSAALQQKPVFIVSTGLHAALTVCTSRSNPVTYNYILLFVHNLPAEIVKLMYVQEVLTIPENLSLYKNGQDFLGIQ